MCWGWEELCYFHFLAIMHSAETHFASVNGLAIDALEFLHISGIILKNIASRRARVRFECISYFFFKILSESPYCLSRLWIAKRCSPIFWRVTASWDEGCFNNSFKLSSPGTKVCFKKFMEMVGR